jgi:Zn-dependent protease with chaperone function
MKLREYIGEIVDELPEEAAELVRARIRWEIRPAPTAEDLERGCKKGDRGYFYGFRVKGEDEIDLEGEGEGEVFLADDDDDVAEVPEYRAGGVIALFTRNIGKLTRSSVRDVVLHELAHFLGEDEAGALELGLGDDEDGG